MKQNRYKKEILLQVKTCRNRKQTFWDWEGIVATGHDKFTCNSERIDQTVHSSMLFLPGCRNIHPCISPQILDCHLHILREGKRGESIKAYEKHNRSIKIKQHHQAVCL
jgi:hypothetical protein